MAEAGGIDISSYPKPTLGPSVLDTAGKLGGLHNQALQAQQQVIGIDQNKLKLMNEQWGLINHELSTLLKDPSTTPDKAVASMRNFAQQFKLPPEMVAKFEQEIPRDPAQLKGYLEKTLMRGSSTIEKVNQVYGIPGTQTNNQETLSGTTSIQTGGFRPTTRTPLDIPPTQPGIIGSTGAPQLYGQQPPSTQPVLPVGPINNSAIQGQSNNFGPGNVTGATVEAPRLPVAPPMPTPRPNAASAAPTAPGPTGPSTGFPPLFEEGKANITRDRQLSTDKLTAIKPILQILPYLKDLRTGPTTDTFTRAVATLKANGVLPTEVNDVTVIRQIVDKKIAGYLSGNPVGQRSDNAQTLADAASPNAKTQLSPALERLTKDAIALDRVQAARAGAFKQAAIEGGFKSDDYHKYNEHASTFPNRMDERAFGLFGDKDSENLVDQMEVKLKSTKNKDQKEAEKFFKSLRIAKEQGFY